MLHSEPEVTSGEGEPVVEEPVLERYVYYEVCYLIIIIACLPHSEPEGGEGEPVIEEPVLERYVYYEVCYLLPVYHTVSLRVVKGNLS